MNPTEAELPALIGRLQAGAFVLGLLFGALAQRSHFCTMGALADIVAMGSWQRLRMWALAAGVAMLGFNAMVALGWLRAADTVYAAPRLLWLSHALGGLLFGIGMVLASGCGAKTLVRLGGGNLKSLVVALALGLAAMATLRGITGLARVAWLDPVAIALPAGQDLPSLLAAVGWGGSARSLALPLGGTLGAALLAWALWRPEGREPLALAGGAGVGLLVLALWWWSGVHGHLAEHPQTLEEAWLATSSRKAESFSFVAPFAFVLDWLQWASDRGRGISQGMALVPGVVLGSALAAWAGGQFRWEGFAGVADTARHLVGGTLMGVGGVCALGCTVGQGISGLSTLALGSLITLAGLVAGAVATLRWQVWRLERTG